MQRKVMTSQTRRNILQFLSATTDVAQIHSNIKNASSDAMEKVLSKGLNTVLVETFLKNLSNCRSLNTRLIHLLPCTLTLFHQDAHQSSVSEDESFKCLKRVLSEYGMQLSQHHSVVTTGNSFFVSVLRNLALLAEKLKADDLEEYSEVLDNIADLKLSLDSRSIVDDITTLRKEVSREWLQNIAFYHKLLLSSDLEFTEEAENVERAGYIKGKDIAV